MNVTEPLVWVIADDKAGHRNQALGVASHLGYPYVAKQLTYNALAKLPNRLIAGLTAIDVERSDVLQDPWPDIVISAGRRTVPVARWVKQQAIASGTVVLWNHIMWPPGKRSDIDILAVPEHDKVKSLPSNAITIVGAPHGITTEFLEQHMAQEQWVDRFDDVHHPVITLLIGGDAGHKRMRQHHAVELISMVSELVKKVKGTLLVSTSRRTPPHVIERIKTELTCKHQLYIPGENPGEDNPYYVYLHMADALIITGDSISMCSEAASMGKPTFIYAPDDMVPAKHRAMHQTLFKHRYATPFNHKKFAMIEALVRQPHHKQVTRLNSAKTVADAIVKRYEETQREKTDNA